MEEIVCKICGLTFKNYKSFGWHIKNHEITRKEYYDDYLKKDPTEGICKVCGKETTLREFNFGYSKYHIECVAKDPKIQQRKKDNFSLLSIEEQQLKKDQSKIKYKETCVEKWGVDNYSKTEEFPEKFKSVSLEKYGVSHPNKSDIIKNKNKKEKIKDETIIIFYCEFCGKGFKSRKGMGKHLQVKTKITNCRELYFTKYQQIGNFPWNTTIKCKNENCNSLTNQGGKTGLCHRCATQNVVMNRSRNAKITTKNLNFVKDGKVNWECEFCNISFNTKGKLELHANDKLIKCRDLFFQKYRIKALFPWNNYGEMNNCENCGKMIADSKLCKKCSSQFIANKYQLGNLSYQKILDVYNREYTIKFYDRKYRLEIWNKQLICPICNNDLKDLQLHDKKIHLHHIDFNKLNDDRENLVFLCNSCHPKTNWKRDEFKKFLIEFNYILLNKKEINIEIIESKI